jgi:RNA polymerase sigma-70 factor, ECF subfamily
LYTLTAQRKAEPPAGYLCGDYANRQMTAEPDNLQAGTIPLIDEASFEVVFRDLYQPLCRYALGFLDDADQAEEVVQDVFVRVWERRETLQVSVSMKAYLYRAVHNSALNVIEKHKKNVRLEEAPMRVIHSASNEPGPGEDPRELEQAIADAVETLPAQCRRVFELSRFEEMKYREIADLLGISIKTVENQMGKALRIMRDKLAPFLPFFIGTVLLNLIQS